MPINTPKKTEKRHQKRQKKDTRKDTLQDTYPHIKTSPRNRKAPAAASARRNFAHTIDISMKIVYTIQEALKSELPWWRLTLVD